MFTLLNNHPAHGEGVQRVCRKGGFIRYTRMLAPIGFAAIILAGSFLLFGCGSESKPGGAVAGKKDKDSALQMNTPLVREAGKAPGKTGQVAKLPEQFNGNAKVLPGITREEMDRRNAQAVKIANSPGAKVMPGITREELDRRNAEAVKIANSPGVKVMPGITKQELDRRNAEALKNAPPWFVERMQEASKQAAAQTPQESPVIPAKR